MGEAHMILQKMTIARRRDIDRRGKDVTGAVRTGARKPWASKQRRSVNARVKIASVWAKRVNTREKKCRNDARERLGFAGAGAILPLNRDRRAHCVHSSIPLFLRCSFELAGDWASVPVKGFRCPSAWPAGMAPEP